MILSDIVRSACCLDSYQVQVPAWLDDYAHPAAMFCCWCLDFLGRPERHFPTGSGRAYVLPQMYLLFSPFVYLVIHVLLCLSTDRPEALPHGRNLAEFYNANPKIWGAPPKKLGPKHAKFRSVLCYFTVWLRISPKRGNISKIGKG